MRLEKKHVYFIILGFVFIILILFIFYFSRDKSLLDQTEIDETDFVVERTSIFGDRVVPSETSPNIFGSITEEDKSFVTSIFSTEDSVVEDGRSKLFQLFSGPVSGFSVKTQKPEDKKDTLYLVRLVTRGVGDVYNIETSPYNIIKETSLSSIKIQGGLVLPDNSFVVSIEDDTKQINSKGLFVRQKEDSGLSFTSLGENISFVGKDGENKFFTLRETSDGVVGFVVDTTKPTEKPLVWKSGFSSWRPFWGKNQNIFLQTKASQLTNGYFYRLNENGVLTKLFGPEQGLLVLHNESTNTSLIRNKLGLFLDKNQTKRILLQTDTLPEKCVFGRKHLYCGVPQILKNFTRSGNRTQTPDSWYRGDVLYNDNFYKINTDTTVVTKIDLETQDSERQEIDLINPRLSDDEKFLFFQNKKDYSLWVLEL